MLKFKLSEIDSQTKIFKSLSIVFHQNYVINEKVKRNSLSKIDPSAYTFGTAKSDNESREAKFKIEKDKKKLRRYLEILLRDLINSPPKHESLI